MNDNEPMRVVFTDEATHQIMDLIADDPNVIESLESFIEMIINDPDKLFAMSEQSCGKPLDDSPIGMCTLTFNHDGECGTDL